MTDTTWKTYAGVLPAALVITGEAPLRYLGLALLSAQLWQIRRARPAFPLLTRIKKYYAI